MKVHIPHLQSIVYPDAVVVFESPLFLDESRSILINPLLIVEVASPSGARHDRTKKFWHYQKIPSFKEYVITGQDFPFVKAFYKVAEHTWSEAEANGLDQSVFLQSIGSSIDLKRVYRGINFESIG